MKTCLLMGTLAFAWGFSALPAVASDTATLTINGRVSTPTCRSEVSNNHLQQRCGNSTQLTTLTGSPVSSARGVMTEIVSLPGDATRHIILNRYE